jgi:hypothetical protein
MDCLFILCCNNDCGRNDGTIKLIFTLIGSLSVSLLIFYLTIENQKRKEDNLKKAKVFSKIFSLCEKIMRCSIHASFRNLALQESFYQFKHSPENEKEIDKGRYLKFLDISEKVGLDVVLLNADLQASLGEVNPDWFKDKNRFKEIRDIIFNGTIAINHYKDIFNDDMTLEQVKSLFESAIKIIPENYSKSVAYTNLKSLQDLVYPNLQPKS